MFQRVTSDADDREMLAFVTGIVFVGLPVMVFELAYPATPTRPLDAIVAIGGMVVMWGSIALAVTQSDGSVFGDAAPQEGER